MVYVLNFEHFSRPSIDLFEFGDPGSGRSLRLGFGELVIPKVSSQDIQCVV